MEVRQWDLVAYMTGGKRAVGTVLQCFERGSVRVDTDGVIEKKCIVAVERGKGKDAIYCSREYKEN
jgi:hypothetical protein